jgi:hypothetical protein
MTTSIRILKSLPHQMNTINQIYGDKYLIKRTVFDNYKYIKDELKVLIKSSKSI